MTVTFASTFASARAAYSPANPPPMMTTCRGAEVISTAELEELPPPAGEAFDVAGRGDGVLIAIGGVHPPAEIGPVREGEEWGSAPPPPAAEGPGGADQVEGEPRPKEGPPREGEGQRAPGSCRRRGHT